MDNKKTLAVLQGCETRVLNALTREDTGTETFQNLLQNLGTIRYFLEELERKTAKTAMLPEYPPLATPPEESAEDTAPWEAPQAEPEVTAEVMKTQPPTGVQASQTTESKAAAPALTKAEVQTTLSYLANHKDVDVAGIMNGMGYSKLSDMPTERWAELVDKAKAAVKSDAA